MWHIFMTMSNFLENRYIVIRVSRILVVNIEWMGVKINFFRAAISRGTEY